MNFATSPEQDALVDIARRFGQQHLAPFYQQREREGAFDRPTLREMGKLGFFGVELRAAYGGLGLDCVTAGLVLEALSAADYNIGQLMVTVSLAGSMLAAHGDKYVVEPWLRSILAGETIPAIALTEPGGGSDAANLAARESFGKPLTAYQGVTFPLAEAETHVHACRLMCLHALWLKDQGLPHTAEAAMCKWWGPKLAFEVVQNCLLINGHGAYTTEMPYEQRLRDVLGLQIGDGTAQIMKLVIARHKAARKGVAM